MGPRHRRPLLGLLLAGLAPGALRAGLDPRLVGYWKQVTGDRCGTMVGWLRIDPDGGFADWGKMDLTPACREQFEAKAEHRTGRLRIVGNTLARSFETLDGRPAPPRRTASLGRHFVLDGDRLNLAAWTSRDPAEAGFVRTWKNGDPYPDSILRILPDGTWSDQRLKYRSRQADATRAVVDLEAALVPAPDTAKDGGSGTWRIEGETLVLTGEGHLIRRAWPPGACRLVLRRGALVDPAMDHVRMGDHSPGPPAALTSWFGSGP